MGRLRELGNREAGATSLASLLTAVNGRHFCLSQLAIREQVVEVSVSLLLFSTDIPDPLACSSPLSTHGRYPAVGNTSFVSLL